MTPLARKNLHSDMPTLLPTPFEPRDSLEEIEGHRNASATGAPERFDPNQLDNLDRRFSGLAEEVRRLTSVMGRERLQKEPEVDPAPGSETSSITAKQVKSIIKARRNRADYFRADLFADPAWDILLDLTRAELECQRTSVTSLCDAASVPATTALRWIKTLADEGILIRRMDPLDGRRIFVELTGTAFESMQQYLRRDADCPVAQT